MNMITGAKWMAFILVVSAATVRCRKPANTLTSIAGAVFAVVVFLNKVDLVMIQLLIW